MPCTRALAEEKKTNHFLRAKIDFCDNAVADEPACRRNERWDLAVLGCETPLEVHHGRTCVDHALLDVDLCQNLLDLVLCLLQLSRLHVAFV